MHRWRGEIEIDFETFAKIRLWGLDIDNFMVLKYKQVNMKCLAWKV